MKVVPLLQSLSKDEWHWLGKFVESPVHNRHADVSLLFEVLKRRIAAGQTENLDGEPVFRGIYGLKVPLNLPRLHHLSNYLLGVVEDFLAWREWKKDETDRDYYLLKSLQAHGLEPHFKRSLDRMATTREAQPRRNPQHFRVNYLLSLEDYQHHVRSGRVTQLNLQTLSGMHDTAFIAEKLKIACGVLSRQTVLKMDFDSGLLPTVLAYVEANSVLLDNPAIAIFWWGYKSIIEPDIEANYWKLGERLKSDERAFNKAELNDIYLMLVNYCIRKMNKGDSRYIAEALKWYKSGLDNDLFVQGGVISRYAYGNIVAIALQLKDYSWTKNFIENYKEKLPLKQRQSTHNYNLARYHYSTGNFAEAQPLLLQTDLDDVHLNLNAKMLLLKIYVETAEINPLLSHLDNFSTYLRRQKSLGYHREVYSNILKITQKLVALPPGDAASREKLRLEIESTNPLSERDWFLTQVKR